MRLQQRDRRRGAALVLVMVFGVGAFVLVATLLATATIGLKDESERHSLKLLHGVLRAGVEASVNEINRDKAEDGYDPGGDGVGAILVGPDGEDGWPVEAANGRLLGRFRTVVTLSPTGEKVITVTAAWPAFDHPNRVMAGAQVVVQAQDPFDFDRNALSVTGPFGDPADPEDGKTKIQIKDATVNILDPTNSVPAINVEDTSLYETLLADLVGATGVTVAGADPENPGSGATGADTTTNQGGTLLSSDVLEALSDAINDYVDATVPTIPDDNRLDKDFDDDGDVNLPFGTYVITDKFKADNGTTITGSGTLIIQGDVKLGNDVDLNWDGDIIIAGGDGKAKLTGGKDADITVTGNVIVDSNDDSRLKLHKDSDSVINGSLLILADDKARFELKKDEAFTVNGVLAILGGDEVRFDVDKDSELNVNGTLVVGLGSDGDKDKFRLKFKKESVTNIIFDDTLFEAGLEGLGTFLDGLINPDDLPVKLGSYWERSAVNLVALQEAAIAADQAGYDDPYEE
jgi:hypothetical protein